MPHPSPEAKNEALAVLAALEWEEAALFARRALALVATGDLWTGRDDPAAPFMALDIALTCQVAQVTAINRMRRARHLVELLPRTLTGLQTGQLTIGQALAFLEETEELPDRICTAVEQQVLPRVVGMTPGDTRREVKRAIVAIDAAAAEARRQARRRDRKVWNSPRPDGRALIGAEQSADQAGAFLRALTLLAEGTFAATDDRTLDQQRADLFSHLPTFALTHLEPGAPAWLDFLAQEGLTGLRTCPTTQTSGAVAKRRKRRHKRVQAVILVPVETALDLSDHPAELIGYGPISGAYARELLATAELRKACTDRWTGRMIALDRPLPPHDGPPVNEPPDNGPPDDSPPALPPDVRLERALVRLVLTPSQLRDEPEAGHDASTDLTDLVQLRDTRCTGPGCARPSRDCDLEHAIPHPQGPTSADNLGPVSRRCHNAKTHGGWHLTPHPNGSITWTSPLGNGWTQPPRHRPADHRSLTHPRLVWPQARIELDGLGRRHGG